MAVPLDILHRLVMNLGPAVIEASAAIGDSIERISGTGGILSMLRLAKAGRLFRVGEVCGHGRSIRDIDRLMVAPQC
jgi:hypothetical protein